MMNKRTAAPQFEAHATRADVSAYCRAFVVAASSGLLCCSSSSASPTIILFDPIKSTDAIELILHDVSLTHTPALSGCDLFRSPSR